MSQTRTFLALDIGTVRIGVATADDAVRIAIPYDTIGMNEETFRADIVNLLAETGADVLVVGYPRNQSGDPTAQTKYVEKMITQLDDIDTDIDYQDESLTSVLAEQRIVARRETLTKEAIDKEAATIILQDYLEQRI